MRTKKTIIIYNEALTYEEANAMKLRINDDRDIVMGGDFEIWEKDLETGGMVKLR